MVRKYHIKSAAQTEVNQHLTTQKVCFNYLEGVLRWSSFAAIEYHS